MILYCGSSTTQTHTEYGMNEIRSRSRPKKWFLRDHNILPKKTSRPETVTETKSGFVHSAFRMSLCSTATAVQYCCYSIPRAATATAGLLWAIERIYRYRGIKKKIIN